MSYVTAETRQARRDEIAERAVPKTAPTAAERWDAAVPVALAGLDEGRVALLRRTTKEDWAL